MKNSILNFTEALPGGMMLEDSWWSHLETSHRSPPNGSDTPQLRRPGWQELLGLADGRVAEMVLQQALLKPIGDLTSRPGKRVRGQLVTLSCRLLSEHASAADCDLASEAVELIHAGSLIVDDIEDGSPVRRGEPALHLRYPMPVALNAGNWLYFWPFQLLKDLDVTQEQRRQIYEACHRTLLRAHFGQAIDLGAKIDRLEQCDVAEACMASLRLKTGALMGFAALLGAAIAHVPDDLLPILDDFGCDLGVALQMFDDLGNVIGKCEPAKRYEDLMLARPSWVWACAVHCASDEYRDFLESIRQLPDNGHLENWLSTHRVIDRARQSARTYLDLTFDMLQERLNAAGAHWSQCALTRLRDLGEEIASAYE
jgi:geranylgeranyl pyrophosphate synthase